MDKMAVEHLVRSGYVRDEAVKMAMMRVDRKGFVPEGLRDSAYLDMPLPIPGNATISAMHMHAMVLGALELSTGQRVLEIGAGSGIMLAYMREIVGPSGRVYGIEINEETFEFAKRNLERTGYTDVKLVRADGSRGFAPAAPYDRIIVSAAAESVPRELLDQLKPGGRLIAPVGSDFQELMLVKKGKTSVEFDSLGSVVFIPLRTE